MTVIIIIKAFLVGLVWAGSFYWIISYVFPIVPMPALLYVRNWALQRSDKIAQKNERRGRRIWNLFKGLFKVVTIMLWLGLLAGYLYLLIPVLESYLALEGQDFWMAYGAALAFPTLWVLVRGIMIYRNARIKLQS